MRCVGLAIIISVMLFVIVSGASAQIMLDKFTAKTTYRVGETITYEYAITNTGSSDLTAINLTDDKLGDLTALLDKTTLHLGEVAHASATYTVVESDGTYIENNATANGTYGGSLVQAKVLNYYVNIAIGTTLTVVKTANPDVNVHIGQSVTYNYSIRNPNAVNVTITKVEDNRLGVILLPAERYIRPGGFLNISAVYVVDRNHLVKSGSRAQVINIVGVEGYANFSHLAVAGTASTPITIAYVPEIHLNKTVNASQVICGDSVNYTYEISNPGEINLSNIDLTDTILGNIPIVYPVQGDLNNDHILNISETWTIYAENLNLRDSVTNIGTAGGTDIVMLTRVFDSDDAHVDVIKLHINGTKFKDLSCNSIKDPGDPGLDNWTIELESGGSTITQLTGPDGSYNFTELCPGDYNVSEVLKSGWRQTFPPSVTYNLTLSRTNYSGQDFGNLGDEPLLGIDKTANVSSTRVGGAIEYTINVTNLGNVAIDHVTVVDHDLGINQDIGTLDEGDYRILTPHPIHPATEADACSGWFNNSANASGITPCGAAVGPVADWANVSVDYNSSLGINKSANRTGTLYLGDVIGYTIEVCNTGEINVSNIVVHEREVHSGIDRTYNIRDLAPGECESIRTSHTVSERDICNKSIDNSAWATGTDYCRDDIVSILSWSNLTTMGSSSLSVSKMANISGTVKVGQVVGYTINVNNTGDTAFSQVEVYEEELHEGIVRVHHIGDLPRGHMAQFMTSHRVTQDDICNGSINNSAYATGIDICRDPLRSNMDWANLSAYDNATLSIIKEANVTGPLAIGDVIGYNITICNTGNLKAYGVVVQDSLAGPLNVGDLDGGECKSVNATHSVSQMDICNGSVVNVAQAKGRNHCGKAITSVERTLVVPTRDNASLSINKSANTTGPVGAHDVIEYTITVCNTGNMTVRNITVHDLQMNGSVMTDYKMPIGDLDKGECKTVKRLFEVAEENICGGSGWVNNSAYAEGLDYCDRPVSTLVSGTYAEVWIPAVYRTGMNVTAYGEENRTVNVGDKITYNVTITNTGDLSIDDITVYDSLTGPHTIKKLKKGESSTIELNYTIMQKDVCGGWLNATVFAVGTDFCSNPIHSLFDGHYNVRTNYISSINLTKEANVTGLVALGQPIAYKLTVTNTGTLNVSNLIVTDDLAGIAWPGRDPFEPGETQTFTYEYVVNRTDVTNGSVVNHAYAKGIDFCGNPVNDSASLSFPVRPMLEVNKTASANVVRRGDEITYTIQVCNPTSIPVYDVTVRDVMDYNLPVVDVRPAPVQPGVWHFDVIPAGRCVEIVFVVDVPKDEFTFDMTQGIGGEGYVNVHNDYSTTKEGYVIHNCAYVVTPFTNETFSDCEAVTVEKELGTELSTREHGTGTYASLELIKVNQTNRSIEMNKDMTAVHRPSSFSLPQNRSINYTTLWTEDVLAKNRLTDTSLRESYRYATYIDRESRVKLDENGTTFNTSTEFDGQGHLGFMKKGSGSVVYESREDYTGSFRIESRIDEYGKNVVSEEEVEGLGMASSDKRVGTSQRTYDSGTGEYRKDEQVVTHTNYVEKSLDAVHAPTSFSYPGMNVTQDVKWKEGISSRTGSSAMRGGSLSGNGSKLGGSGSGPASYIGHEIWSAEYVKDDTVARGLNEMETEADFSGSAEFRSILSPNLSGSELIETDEVYVGAYNIKRHEMLTGVSKYDHPHLWVMKEATLTPVRYKNEDCVFVNYTITVVNDGNANLDPLYVRDLFPAGCEYINASVRPAELTSTYANWTLTHLPVGGESVIEMLMNVTEEAGSNLVNMVNVAGVHGSDWIYAFNYSAIEREWLTCCPPDLGVYKDGWLDAADETLIHYRIDLVNRGSYRMAVTVTDTLPGDLEYVDSAIEPFEYGDGNVVWTFADLLPGETLSIAYDARAVRDGAYTNQVHADGVSIDGPDHATANAAAFVFVGETGIDPKTGRYGIWEPPAWGFNTSEEGLAV